MALRAVPLVIAEHTEGEIEGRFGETSLLWLELGGTEQIRKNYYFAARRPSQRIAFASAQSLKPLLRCVH